MVRRKEKNMAFAGIVVALILVVCALAWDRFCHSAEQTAHTTVKDTLDRLYNECEDPIQRVVLYRCILEEKKRRK